MTDITEEFQHILQLLAQREVVIVLLVLVIFLLVVALAA